MLVHGYTSRDGVQNYIVIFNHLFLCPPHILMPAGREARGVPPLPVMRSSDHVLVAVLSREIFIIIIATIIIIIGIIIRGMAPQGFSG